MTAGNIRVVFMGTPDFALPSLRALASHPACQVVAAVTQPDRPVGRKRVVTPPPVKVAAESLGIPVLQPVRAGAPETLAELAELAPDVIVTAAYGQLLPQRLLDIPRCGCLNVHASLLPRWRGAAPIQRAIMAGDAETGVTVMVMVKALDAGPMVAVERVPIRDEDNAGTLHDKLADVGAALLCRVLPDYVAGTLVPTPQPEVGVTYAEKITRADEWIDWRRSTTEIWRHVRALAPLPGAVADLQGTPVKILAASPVPAGVALSDETPGTIVRNPQVGVCVRTRDGWIRLETVQPSGKRRMSAEDWMRGMASDGLVFNSKTEVDA
ncbi:methionyl-tRNA formyltransferase [Alicyclobacillus contaminans]|uniref:methionyl-tRNA formyltransferase n=1 Tax=Alicyclobacillus contaminans TaxID=392016 RepID=UPI00040DF5E1|nr:methionyl-tRNA formyltransferase [Alicyclobacillus contaminans]GMA49114.1 methionyl-tRNA formyltransferase [Alicyclobacillus contaminans]